MKKHSYEAVICEELSTLQKRRYIVRDIETKKVLDNANGYGYKSKYLAYKAYAFKINDKEEIDRILRNEKLSKTISAWCKQHRSFISSLEKYQYMAIEENPKDYGRLTLKYLNMALKDNNIKEEELKDFSTMDLVKHLRQ